MVRSLFIALIFLGFVPMILAQPHVGLLVWTWISYFNPHRLASGFINDLQPLLLLGGLTIVVWFFSREPKRPPPHPLFWALVIFLGWTVITTLVAPDFDLKWHKLDTFWRIIFVALLCALMLTTRQRIEQMLLMILLSLAFYMVRGAFGTIVSGGKYVFQGPPETFIADRNSLSLAFTMALPLMVYFHKWPAFKGLRPMMIPAIVLCVIAVLGSQSRGGWLSLLIASIGLIMMSRRRLLGMAALVCVGLCVAIFIPQSWVERLHTIQTYETDTSAQGRLQMWRYALDLSGDHPLAGGGFKAFANRRLAANYLPPGIPLRAAHSVYFEALGEHGIPGLILYVNILICFILTCSAIRRACVDRMDLLWAYDLAGALRISAVAFCVGGAFLELVVFDLCYQLAMITVALHMLVKRTPKNTVADIDSFMITPVRS